MRILISCEHYAVSSGRYMRDAFKRLGYDVRSTGPSKGVQIWGGVVDEKYEWIPDTPPDGWAPDLVVHMDGNWFPPERYADCPHVVYGVDNHVRDYRCDINWDHLFLAHSYGHRMDEDNVTWLPCAYDPVFFTPGPAIGQRSFDAAMMGVMYANRAEILYMIRTHVNAARTAYGTGPVYTEYARIYQDAKVALCPSAALDVAIRIFEGAAMGCVVIMDRCHDAEKLGLVGGENCLIYDASHEVPALLQSVIDHPHKAQKIANAGLAWARDHTFDARAATIIEWSEKQNKPKKQKAKKDVEG